MNLAKCPRCQKVMIAVAVDTCHCANGPHRRPVCPNPVSGLMVCRYHQPCGRTRPLVVWPL
jgi:hypothetical protein